MNNNPTENKAPSTQRLPRSKIMSLKRPHFQIISAPINNNDRKASLLQTENKIDQEIHAQKALRYAVRVNEKQQEDKIRPTQAQANKVSRSFFFGHLDTKSGVTSNTHGNKTFSRGSRSTRRRRGRKVAPAT